MRVCVVMPAFNEAEGIAGFLREIEEALRPVAISNFVVVDDASSDATSKVLQEASRQGMAITIIINANNCGHGASTLRALGTGLSSESEVVVAVDGDGQFTGTDIARLVNEMTRRIEVDVIEGARTARIDPLYRRLTSFATRALVWSRCHSWPRDANTPLRVYRPSALARLLDAVPPDSSIPNLMISVLARRWGMEIAEVSVTSLPRRGSVKAGSTWGAKTLHIPTRRYLVFCMRSTRQWFTSPLNESPYGTRQL